MSRPAKGVQTHSCAPSRMVEFPDGANAINLNRKPGFFVAVMIVPDGRVTAASAPTRKDALAQNITDLGMTAEQVRRYHGSNNA